MWILRGFAVFELLFMSIYVHGYSGNRLKRFENCDHNPNLSANYNVTIRTVGDKQYLDATLILKAPIDDTLRSNVTIDILAGKNYIYLFSINEKKSCTALHKYMGEFIYDVERHAQLIPGMCPIPQGRYHLHNYQLNYEKIATAVNFPFGSLRFTDVVHKRNNDIHSCIVAEIDHLL